MREETIKVYQFDELSDRAKEKAREWYRSASADDSYWSENVIEDAATVCERMGFDVRQRSVKLMGGGTRMEPAIYFSGFWSQGDGACFEASWSPSSIMSIGDFACEYPGTWQDTDGKWQESKSNLELQRIHAESVRLAALDPENQISWQCRQSGRGNAEYNTTFDYDDERNENDDGNMPEDIEDAHIENARDAMRWIYRQLESEYEWQNADEQVDESIRANEYEFTEDGERY